MRSVLNLAAVPVLALLAGCSPLSVKYDYDRSASFAGSGKAASSWK